MTAENTRAALPGDLVARLRGWANPTPHTRAHEPAFSTLIEAADALAARDAEIARLRAALWAALPHLPGARSISHETPHGRALAALSPPPASDGEKP